MIQGDKMKFRKKPIIIEAMQFTSKTKGEVLKWVSCPIEYCDIMDDGNQLFKIKTLEGDMMVINGDWIIKGVNGEFYPCKPDIFEKSYDRINDEEIQ